MSVTGGIIAGVGLAGSIGSAAIGANAAGNAANTQATAAENAQALEYKQEQQALGFQEGVYGQNEANEAPFLASGEGGLANLDYLLGITPPTTQGASAGQPGSFTGVGANAGGATGPTGTTSLGSMVNPGLGGFGSLTQAYPGGPFVAPTAQQALQSPGEQAQLQLGEQAQQQSAAAGGNLLTGGFQQGLNAYAQNLASTNYQSTYNNAYNTYASGYNQYENQQTNTYNRLAALAGMGQTTANTLGTLGQTAANNVGNISLTGGAQQAQQINNAGAANASGIVGAGNAWSGGLGGATSGLGNLFLLNQLYSGGGGGGYNNDSGLGGTPSMYNPNGTIYSPTGTSTGSGYP